MSDCKAAENLIRFAVIGLGLMGERHCRLIQALPGAKLVGIFDRHEAALGRAATEHGVNAYSSYEDVLADELVDAVVICLPSSLHAEFGIQAAQAGKHVVVEKPIDSQSNQGKQLVQACERANVVCAVIAQNRYSAGLAAIKTAIETGLMGKITLARATVKWFRHDEYYTQSYWRGRISGEHGGVLINQAIHSIDTLQWLFGAPQNVTGYIHLNRPQVMETEDTAVAIMQWSDGLLASLEASTCSAPGFNEAYEFHSSVASARVEKGELVYWFHQDGQKPPEIDVNDSPHSLNDKLKLFYRQYLNILAAIENREPLDVKPHEAVAVVETVERIYSTCRSTSS